MHFNGLSLTGDAQKSVQTSIVWWTDASARGCVLKTHFLVLCSRAAWSSDEERSLVCTGLVIVISENDVVVVKSVAVVIYREKAVVLERRRDGLV